MTIFPVFKRDCSIIHMWGALGWLNWGSAYTPNQLIIVVNVNSPLLLGVLRYLLTFSFPCFCGLIVCLDFAMISDRR